MSQSAVPAAVAPDTLLAGADLSAKNHRFLAMSADHTVIVATGPTDAIVGVQDDKPFGATGAQVGFRHLAGPSLVEAGGVFAAGAYLSSDGVGRAVSVSTGQQYHAKATKASLAAGDLVAVTLTTGVVP